MAVDLCEFRKIPLKDCVLTYNQDHADYWRGNLWKKTLYGLHIILILISAFMTIGGTYGVIVQIMDAYKDGSIDSAFSCADNSNSS